MDQVIYLQTKWWRDFNYDLYFRYLEAKLNKEENE